MEGEPSVPSDIASVESSLHKTEKTVRKQKKNKQPKVYKRPRAIFIPIASDFLFYKGVRFTRGDIVSAIDSNHRVYYAQIRGLLQNQYDEKRAILTWLCPSSNSPKGKFDPNTYIFSYNEDIPRDLECLEFVSRCPSEYFKGYNPPYPEFPHKPVLGYAQTSKGYVVVKLPVEDFTSDDDVYFPILSK